MNSGAWKSKQIGNFVVHPSMYSLFPRGKPVLKVRNESKSRNISLGIKA